MAFSETLKSQIRKLTDMRCCICQAVGVEIHHIKPQHEGGLDTIENAAPLCPTCHETYGENPRKRKWIKEARDNWYDKCSNSATLTQELVARIEKLSCEMQEGFAAIKGAELSLGDLLGIIYNIDKSCEYLSKSEVDFLMEFYFGGAITPEFDAVKRTFVDFFGRETARRCCAYFAIKNGLNLEGFTEPEMAQIGAEMSILMAIMTELHEEITSDPKSAMGVKRRSDGELLFHLTGRSQRLLERRLMSPKSTKGANKPRKRGS